MEHVNITFILFFAHLPEPLLLLAAGGGLVFFTFVLRRIFPRQDESMQKLSEKLTK
jgi:hypothetical protein